MRRLLCAVSLCIPLSVAVSSAQVSSRSNFLPAPGRFAVGLTVSEVTDDSRPPLPGTASDAHASGRRLQIFKWYAARANGAGIDVLDYFRLVDATSEKEWKTQKVPADLVKSFGMNKVPMLAHLDAPFAGVNFPSSSTLRVCRPHRLKMPICVSSWRARDTWSFQLLQLDPRRG